ncbi:30S ribosomal protein S6e [archaeon BMS3Bbin16]|nr:30S ribosomal protein S6e [archaeon BMS3Bbin16]
MLKIVLSDPKENKAHNIELDDVKAAVLVGSRVGTSISGKDLGLTGYTIKITGGSDKDGTPMRHDVHGTTRTRALLGKGQGHRQTEKGIIKRKLVRGNIVTNDIVQVNAVVVKHGAKAIDTLVSGE